MIKNKSEYVTSPIFILGLAILILNDFRFKHVFHNGITGKLSDISGLFIFPLFWVTFFPKKRFLIYVLTAMVFVYWKSSLSQNIIDYWNDFGVLQIGRTVDYSDYFALLVLPISYLMSIKGTKFFIKIPHKITKITKIVVIIACMFAFIATSSIKRYEYQNTYNFPVSKDNLLKTIKDYADINKASGVDIEKLPSDSTLADRLTIRMPGLCSVIRVVISVQGDMNNSFIVLNFIAPPSKCDRDSRDNALKAFENNFIEVIKKDIVVKANREKNN